ncbi:hypothetical protein JST97_20145 [bacterium]|nr:hypothetical protein [bacterium]
MFDFEYSLLPDSDRQFVRFLVHCLRYHPDQRVRYICAHHANPQHGERLTSALLARAGDPSEHPTVRGECLESLSTSWKPPWSRLDRKVHRVVAQCLRDSDPYIRFWACYCAACNRMIWLIPVLETMVEDAEPAAMGETVGFEAREAIKALTTGMGWEEGFPSQLPPARSYENLAVNPYVREERSI